MDKNPYVDELGRIWKYGELLPLDLSPFAYNETIAQDHYPITQKGARDKQIPWYENKQEGYTITIKKDKVPNRASELDEKILKEVIECGTCEDAFNINKIELMLLKKLNMPCPTSCWKCRHNRRLSRVNKAGLYDRKCDKCSSDIKTSYSPDRTEIIYCEKCYQQEFV